MLSGPPHFRLLAAFQALAGLAIVPFLLQGQPEQIIVGLVAVVWLLLAGVNWLFAERLPTAAFEASLYTSAVVVAVHTASTPRPQMQILDGLELLVLGMFAAFALEPPRVNLWLAISNVGYLVGLVLNPLPIGVWLGPVIVIMVIGSSTVTRNLIRQVRDVSRHDPLTGALNRWGLADQATLLQAVSVRSGTPLSVVFVDLDGFKIYNDSHGHLAGDHLLTEVARSLQNNLRTGDLVARIGGDEFVLVMTGATSAQADHVLQRIGPRLPIAVSHGAVDWAPGDELATMIDLADRKMYQRKALRIRSRPPYDGASERR